MRASCILVHLSTFFIHFSILSTNSFSSVLQSSTLSLHMSTFSVHSANWSAHCCKIPTFSACISSPEYAGVWGQGGGLGTWRTATFSLRSAGLLREVDLEPEEMVGIREATLAAQETDSCALEAAAKAALTPLGRVLEGRGGISTTNEELGTEEDFFPWRWRIFLEGPVSSGSGEWATPGVASSPAPPGEKSG